MSINKLFTLFIRVLAISVLMHGSIFAEGVNVTGTIQHIINQPADDISSLSTNKNHVTINKEIQLLHVELSDSAKALLVERAKQAQKHSSPFAIMPPQSLDLEEHVQLGMNNVPVLDQGIHGTCVVFALTAAIDAVIGKGDYISQLCQLQLGSYLENHGYDRSGWNGTWPINVIRQIEQYGIVNKSQQRSKGCGGLYSYPTYSKHSNQSFIEPEAFQAMSELVFGKVVNWADMSDLFTPTEKKLYNLKRELQSGNRVVIAVLIPRIDLGTVGAVGKHKTWFYKDSWVLTPEILKDADNADAGHAMVITGYDDNAVAVDPHGVKHRGLISLRNSWGESLGNYGEFYMSYDYFTLLSYNLKRISPN